MSKAELTSFVKESSLGFMYIVFKGNNMSSLYEFWASKRSKISLLVKKLLKFNI